MTVETQQRPESGFTSVADIAGFYTKENIQKLTDQQLAFAFIQLDRFRDNIAASSETLHLAVSVKNIVESEQNRRKKREQERVQAKKDNLINGRMTSYTD